MKLYLFGGAELSLGQDIILKKLIKEVIASIHPSSVLHIPFARLHPTEEAFHEGWFKELMSDTGIEILDARNQEDIDRAISPLIFINGGHGHADLTNGINSNKRICDLILNAECIVGESRGSMITAAYMREDKIGETFSTGLGILKDTIIEPHYSERHSEELLTKEMKQTHARYGIGIDCATAIVVDPAEFPSNWTKMGGGVVDVRIGQ